MSVSVAQTIKQGDTGPSLTTTITINGVAPTDPAAGEPALPELWIRKEGASCWTQATGTMVIVDSPTWQLRFDWAAADTDTPGLMACEWRFTQGTGAVPHTAPSGGYDFVRVLGRDDC